MIGVVGTDIFIDGLLIGIAASLGRAKAALVTIALAVELLSLGLAKSAALGKSGASRIRSIRTVCLLALLPVVGATAGGQMLSGLSGGWMEAMLAFAAAALLYLVTEELLVEAHEVSETPLSTAAFFAGFLALMLVEMVAATTGR